MTLVEFLLARIDEDEAAARKVAAPMPMSGIKPVSVSFGKVVGLMIDPARVLAECDAKRQVVEHYALWSETLMQPTPDGWTEQAVTAYRMAMTWTVKTMAQSYAAHPDFDPDWTAG